MEFFLINLKTPITENLLCYSINPAETQKIDPNKSSYLISEPETISELPEGKYLLTQQKKEKLEDKELEEMAIELQKEILWRRLKPANKLMVRFFYEDNSPVIQLLRPISG